MPRDKATKPGAIAWRMEGRGLAGGGGSGGERKSNESHDANVSASPVAAISNQSGSSIFDSPWELHFLGLNGGVSSPSLLFQRLSLADHVRLTYLLSGTTGSTEAECGEAEGVCSGHDTRQRGSIS